MIYIIFLLELLLSISTKITDIDSIFNIYLPPGQSINFNVIQSKILEKCEPSQYPLHIIYKPSISYIDNLPIIEINSQKIRYIRPIKFSLNQDFHFSLKNIEISHGYVNDLFSSIQGELYISCGLSCHCENGGKCIDGICHCRHGFHGEECRDIVKEYVFKSDGKIDELPARIKLGQYGQIQSKFSLNLLKAELVRSLNSKFWNDLLYISFNVHYIADDPVFSKVYFSQNNGTMHRIETNLQDVIYQNNHRNVHVELDPIIPLLKSDYRYKNTSDQNCQKDCTICLTSREISDACDSCCSCMENTISLNQTQCPQEFENILYNDSSKCSIYNANCIDCFSCSITSNDPSSCLDTCRPCIEKDCLQIYAECGLFGNSKFMTSLNILLNFTRPVEIDSVDLYISKTPRIIHDDSRLLEENYEFFRLSLSEANIQYLNGKLKFIRQTDLNTFYHVIGVNDEYNTYKLSNCNFVFSIGQTSITKLPYDIGEKFKFNRIDKEFGESIIQVDSSSKWLLFIADSLISPEKWTSCVLSEKVYDTVLPGVVDEKQDSVISRIFLSSFVLLVIYLIFRFFRRRMIVPDESCDTLLAE